LIKQSVLLSSPKAKPEEKTEEVPSSPTTPPMQGEEAKTPSLKVSNYSNLFVMHSFQEKKKKKKKDESGVEKPGEEFDGDFVSDSLPENSGDFPL